MKLLACLLLIFCLSTFSCDYKAVDCYDAQMEEEHPGVCTKDCPGVCGCDGAFYCNTCVANRNGISVDPEGSCN